MALINLDVCVVLTSLFFKQHITAMRTMIKDPATTPAVALLPQGILLARWGRREMSSSFDNGNTGMMKIDPEDWS